MAFRTTSIGGSGVAPQPAPGTGLLQLSTTFANVTDNTSAMIHLSATSYGAISVSKRSNAIVAIMRDAANVVNKTITGAVDNGSGLVRITCVAHTFATGDEIYIYGVTGTTEANGGWVITVIDVDTFDLQGSVFANAYVNGGTATNRPMYYVNSALVFPALDRDGSQTANADDVNCYVGYNGGPGRGTDCYYVGRNSTGFPASAEWAAGFTCDAYVRYGAFKSSAQILSGGAVFRGQDATIDAGGYFITSPNNALWGAKNNAGTLVELFRINTSDQVAFAQPVLISSSLQIANAQNISIGTSTGTKIGTATGQKIAFHNSTPVIQRAGAAQAAVVTTGSALASYGYTQAQADSIVTLVNELRAALVEKGLIKGAA